MEKVEIVYRNERCTCIGSEVVCVKQRIAVEAHSEDRGHRAYAAKMDMI